MIVFSELQWSKNMLIIQFWTLDHDVMEFSIVLESPETFQSFPLFQNFSKIGKQKQNSVAENSVIAEYWHLLCTFIASFNRSAGASSWYLISFYIFRFLQDIWKWTSIIEMIICSCISVYFSTLNLLLRFSRIFNRF